MPAAMFFNDAPPPVDSDYFCPLCGGRCLNRGNWTDSRAGHEGMTAELFDCQNRSCKLYTATTTADNILSGTFADKWKFTPVYDFTTGRKIDNE